MVYAGSIAGFFLAVMIFRVIGSLGAGAAPSTARSSFLDALNYTLPALAVCGILALARRAKASESAH